MRADIADCDGSVGRNFALDAERPGDERRGFHVGLNAARYEFGSRGNRSGRIDWEAGDFEIGNSVDRIEGSILIGAIAESVLEIVVDAEASTENCLLVDGTPSQGDARLSQEFGVIFGEEI